MESLNLKGHMTATLIKPDGSTQTQEKDNLIVNAGFDFIANSMCLNTTSRPAVMSHIGIGTTNTAAASGDTALKAQVARKAATYSHSAGTKTFTLTASFAPGVGTGSIVEAGVFNGASGGIMLDRVVFSTITKAAADTLNVTFTFTLS